MITAYKHVRMLVSILKQRGIRHFVCSPGSRNIALVKSIEDDPFFTCYSVADERSAAYFAVGLYLEVQSPVVITCTSAQATRNYMPGLTEAFYRKAKILAITSDYDDVYTSQLNMQSIQQMNMPSDAANVSVDLPLIKDTNDEFLVNRRINLAVDALYRNGGGPSHINIRINQHWIKGEDELEPARLIQRYTAFDESWPDIGKKKVLIVVGQHSPFNARLKNAFDSFCEKYEVFVYVNHISNYHGEYSLNANRLLFAKRKFDMLKPDIVITMGGHLGDYAIDGALKNNRVEHWRLSEDGAYNDTYNTLSSVFECPEFFFFERYAASSTGKNSGHYYKAWLDSLSEVSILDEIPLSHALVARQLSPVLPRNSVLHMAILSSLRNWELVDLDESIRCYSNVAGFGIDGCMSTFLGHSVSTTGLAFLVIGDLAFFYDMNSLGIRHIRNNVRIVLINNGGGGEFRLFSHSADNFGDATNRHIAAAGHYGRSAKGWAENNNFGYVGVHSKESLVQSLDGFVGSSDRPMLMEIFTTMRDDSDALEDFVAINDERSTSEKLKSAVKSKVPTGLKTGLKKLFR